MGKKKSNQQEKERLTATHPKRLLGEKALVTPGPQVACAENRSLGPHKVCAEPVCNSIIRPVFPQAVEGVGVEAAGVQDHVMGWNMIPQMKIWKRQRALNNEPEQRS